MAPAHASPLCHFCCLGEVSTHISTLAEALQFFPLKIRQTLSPEGEAKRLALRGTHMANDLTVHSQPREVPETCCEQRDQMQAEKTFPAGQLLLPLGHRCCWCVLRFSFALTPSLSPSVGRKARWLSGLLLSSVFLPISNYLLVSEVQPRIVHGISPTSSSPCGHRWVFRRGKSALTWPVMWTWSGSLEKLYNYRFPGTVFSSSLSFSARREWLKRKCGSRLRTNQGREVWPKLCLLASPLTPSLKTLRQLPFTSPKVRQLW